MTIEDFPERRANRGREVAYIGPNVLQGPFMRDYRRHTVDVDVRYIQETLRTDRLWAWCTFWCFVGAAIGYVVTRFVVLGLVGG